MPAWRNAPGTIDPPVVYFEVPKDFYNGTKLVRQGGIIIAPHSDHPTPEGYVRKECRYLHEVDKLTKRMNQQDFNEFNDLMAKDRQIMQQRRDKTRSTLKQRMLAADCTMFERRFIQGALVYLDRKEKENTEFAIRGFFTQREYDSPSTDPIDNYGTQVKTPKMSDRLAALLSK